MGKELSTEALICILIHSALMRQRFRLGFSERDVKRIMGVISPIIKGNSQQGGG
jgi:hypothetical protein